MTDQQALFIALCEAGRIIAENLEPGLRDAEETIKQLIAVLESRQFAPALSGAGRRHVSVRYRSVRRSRREVLLRHRGSSHHRQAHRPHPPNSPPDDLLTLTAELAALALGIEMLVRNALGVETIELRHPRAKDMGSRSKLYACDYLIVGIGCFHSQYAER